MNYFVSAIGTDSGKTLVAAILCEALGADYWKPVQAGLPTDTDTLRSLVTNPKTSTHPERYKLQLPASPHAAAIHEGIDIHLEDFVLPPTKNHLVVEGAGGLMVPINDQHFMVDLALHLKMEIILVSNTYLGSINHTLLSHFLLQQKNIPVRGIVFNGPPNPESERIILHHTGYPLLLHVFPEPIVNSQSVKKYAAQLKIVLS